jgi:hypothetical protein
MICQALPSSQTHRLIRPQGAPRATRILTGQQLPIGISFPSGCATTSSSTLVIRCQPSPTASHSGFGVASTTNPSTFTPIFLGPLLLSRLALRCSDMWTRRADTQRQPRVTVLHSDPFSLLLRHALELVLHFIRYGVTHTMSTISGAEWTFSA